MKHTKCTFHGLYQFTKEAMQILCLRKYLRSSVIALETCRASYSIVETHNKNRKTNAELVKSDKSEGIPQISLPKKVGCARISLVDGQVFATERMAKTSVHTGKKLKDRWLRWKEHHGQTTAPERASRTDGCIGKKLKDRWLCGKNITDRRLHRKEISRQTTARKEYHGQTPVTGGTTGQLPVPGR